MMDPSWDLKRWQKMVLTVDSPVTNSKIMNYRGLKSRIISLYRGDTWSEIILLEKTRAKIARRDADYLNPKICSSSIKHSSCPDDGSQLGFETLAENGSYCGFSGD